MESALMFLIAAFAVLLMYDEEFNEAIAARHLQYPGVRYFFFISLLYVFYAAIAYWCRIFARLGCFDFLHAERGNEMQPTLQATDNVTLYVDGFTITIEDLKSMLQNQRQQEDLLKEKQDLLSKREELVRQKQNLANEYQDLARK